MLQRYTGAFARPLKPKPQTLNPTVPPTRRGPLLAVLLLRTSDHLYSTVWGRRAVCTPAQALQGTVILLCWV